MRSYAQNFEDVILWRALKHVDKGFYLDVGANDPVTDSVSLAFYERGWRGVHVEPMHEYAQRLRAARPDEPVIEAALALNAGAIPLFVFDGTGLSTGLQSYARVHTGNGRDCRIEKVATRTLASVFDDIGRRDIHWMKIDVEGMEDEVLRSWCGRPARPWVIVVESTLPNSPEQTSGGRQELLDLGYDLAYFDGLNRFYVHGSHPELRPAFGPGPNYFDGFNLTENSAFVVPLAEQLRAQSARIDTLAAGHERAVADLKAEIRRLEAERRRHDAALAATVREKDAALAATVRRKDAALAAAVQHRDAKLAATVEHYERHIAAQHDVAARNAEDLPARIEDLQAQVDAFVNSTSWRLTRPLRAMALAGRRVLLGASALAHGEIGAWARRFARRRVKALGDGVLGNRHSRAAANLMLQAFPGLRTRLIRVWTSESGAGGDDPPVPAASPHDLTGEHVRPARFETTIFVFVDHTVACPVNSGVQRTARGVASGLTAAGARLRYVRWDASIQDCVLLNRSERAALARWNGPPLTADDEAVYAPGPGRGLFPDPQPGDWLLVPEVTHITYQGAPVTLDLMQWAARAGMRTGFIFYDAIPLRRREFADLRDAHIAYMRALRLADVVWPISHWSAGDLLAFWSEAELARPDAMPVVAPLRLSGNFGRPRSVRASAGQRTILSFGTLEPRKNQLGLIRAFRAWRAANPTGNWRLELVGNLHPLVKSDLEAALAAEPAISFLGNVSDEELAARLDNCAFTAFPSLEEGFGLPILESLWAGKPCLCADFGAMGELAKGGGCLAVDVADDEVLAGAVATLIADEALRSQLTAEALTRPIPGWREYAANLRESLRAATAPVTYYWVNVTPGFPKNTGIQRVVRQLARQLMDQGRRLVPVKFDKSQCRLSPVPPADLEQLARWNGPAPEQWSPWVEPALAGDGSCFLMAEMPHELSPAEHAKVNVGVRAAGLRVIAVFYDTIPYALSKEFPTFYRSHWADRHRAYMLELAKSDVVLAISNDSARDYADFLDSEFASRTGLARIIPLPLAGEFPESPRVASTTTGTAAPLHILCVGTIEPRKNQVKLIEAFELAQERSGRPLRLTLVGRRTDAGLAGLIEGAAARNPAITWTEDADDARLRNLFLDCVFTVYPSVKEGFGLPILESLWYGKPTICADFGAMMEVARGGGCHMVDVRSVAALADAIVRLADDSAYLGQLTREAASRPVVSWSEYAHAVGKYLPQTAPARPGGPALHADARARARAMAVTNRPVLSVCISTYNRAEWLATSLRNWARLHPEPVEGVELLVVDNASTDHTADVVQPYLARPDFTFRRNRTNVGMLGNLRVTAHAAKGNYIWILGDDDLMVGGAIDRILGAISTHPGTALVYLNYAYTRIADARQVGDFERFFAEASPIVPAEPDRHGRIKEICARNENFFTAIYTLVFRRDHAIRAYSQDTSGRPFSTMLTAIPTTYYVLHHMMDEPGVWIGTPQVIVNMNVSWMKYAPLWILERIPEVYETAMAKGAARRDIDRWRSHTLPGMVSYFKQILEHDPLDNAAFVSFPRVVRRFADLPGFATYEAELRDAYRKARAAGSPAARAPIDVVFPHEPTARDVAVAHAVPVAEQLAVATQ